MAEPISRHAIAETTLDRGGRSAWGAILAGVVVSQALFLALALLGLGIGVVSINPNAADVVEGSMVGTGIFVIVAQLISLGVGGFVAGRLAGVLHSMGAMLHGAAVWGVATLILAWIGSSAALGLANLAGNAVSAAASGAASAASAVIPDDLSLPDVSAANVSFDDLPDPVQATLEENGITPGNFQAEAQEALRSVISQSEQANAREAVTDTASDLLTSPGDAGQDIEQLTDELFGAGGVLSEEDRQEALAVVEERFGVTPQEAEQFVDQVQARAQELQAQAEAAVEDARQTALEAAAAANEALRTAGFLGFLASILGLAAAVGGAVAGRVKAEPEY
ncbi:MAG: hypothetical protein ACU0BF_10055 [Paracoccaceae bacterium]